MNEAFITFQHSTSESSIGEKALELTGEQRRRREFYSCFQRHDKLGDSHVILANVGLACLAIRRFLQASVLSPQSYSRSHMMSREI